MNFLTKKKGVKARANNMWHFVYQTENTINNMSYTGVHSTDNIYDGYMGCGVYLKKAIKRYGIENFKRTIIAFFPNRTTALVMEKVIIGNNWTRSDSYNLCPGGRAGKLNYKRTDESKQKMSNTHKGKRLTESHKNNIRIAITGRKHSKETKQKISNAHKGKQRIDMQGSKNFWYGKTRSGSNNPMYNRKHSEKTKNRLSEIAKKRKVIPNASPIEIDGVRYPSIKAASEGLNMSIYFIYKMINDGKARRIK